MADPTYNFFDQIHCISLKSRDDRYRAAQDTFNKLGIKNVKFYRPEKHPTDPTIGCFESHLHVVKESYEKNHKYILIFEDDAVPTKDYDPSLIQEGINFMKNNPNWEIFMLGYGDFALSMVPVTKNIVKLQALMGHAYCLSRRGMKKVVEDGLNFLYRKRILPGIKVFRGIDAFYSIKLKMFGLYPMQFDQNWSLGTDNKYPIDIINMRHKYMPELDRILNFISYHDVHVILVTVFALFIWFIVIKNNE